MSKRSQILQDRIALSPKLSEHFAATRLTQSQKNQLKAFCEAYQDGEGSAWAYKNYYAYSLYFGLQTALKAKQVMTQLERWNYLKVLEAKPISIIDVGAGSLGASIGITDFFRDRAIEVQQVLAMDRDLRAGKWAAEYFQAYLPRKVILKRKVDSDLRPRNSIFVMANVWAEIGIDHKNIDRFKRWMDQANDKSIFVIIEPASKKLNQELLRMRDELVKDYSLLLPCPHSKACPALIQKEWCHEEWPYEAPSRYWELVESLGFNKSQLGFSLLVFGKQKSAFTAKHARVVSRPLKTKGLSSKWLCQDGKRWKEQKLLRDQNEANQDFYEARRGYTLKYSAK